MRTELIESRVNEVYSRITRDRARHMLAGMMLNETINMSVEEPDYRNYSYAGGAAPFMIGGSVQKDMMITDNSTIRAQSYRLYYTDPYVRNVIRTLVKFVFGKGVKVDIKPDQERYQDITNKPNELEALTEADKVLVRQVKNYLKLFYDKNKWPYKQKEIGTRAFRDGEAFIYIRDKGAKGEPPSVSFLEPDWIMSKNSDISFGIETDKDDVEEIVSYRLMMEGPNGPEVIVPPDKIVHIKLWVDSNVKRGRPVMEPVFNKVKMYDDWLNNRMILNRVRSAVALVKYVEGSEGQVKAMVNRQKAATEDTRQDNKTKMLVPGSVVTASKGVKYEFLSPNLGAVDAATDGRNLLSTIAAGVGFPEMFLSGDFSNSNMASSYVAQNPIVREFEDYQDTFDMYLQELIRRVIKLGIENGDLPEDSINLSLTVGWPPLIYRDLAATVTALEKLRQNNVISLHTFADESGHDFDEEQRKIQEERETMPPEDLGFDPFGDQSNGNGNGQQFLQSDDWLRRRRGVDIDENFSGFDDDDLDESYPNHPGRPGKVGGSSPKSVAVSAVKRVQERAWRGKTVANAGKTTKDETGKVGEALAIRLYGAKSLQSNLKLKQNNLAFDSIDVRHRVLYEVKAGWAGNKNASMKWRLTKGTYSKGEQEYYDRLGGKLREQYNQTKDSDIFARKNLMQKAIEAKYGKKFTVKEITFIWNPRMRIADMYEFKGVHKEIRWRHPYVQDAFKGSFQFSHTYK